MELLERYLVAVRSFLPPAQQDDIEEELSANLHAQMEDRAAALGRPLTESEQEAIIQQHGHPMVVAARYQAHQGGLVFGRQLIGPALFPMYLRVLWVTMGVSVAIYLLVRVALVVAGNAMTFDEMLNTALVQLVIQFAVVTGIFAVADNYLPAMEWDARRPPVMPAIFRQGQLRPYLQAIVEIAVIVLCCYGLWLLFTRPSLLFGAAADPYQPGPIWQQVVWPALAIALVSIAMPIITLVRPVWARARPVLRLAVDVAVLGVLVYLALGSQWVVLAHAGSGSTSALTTINAVMFYSLRGLVIGTVVVCLLDGWKLLRQTRKRPA